MLEAGWTLEQSRDERQRKASKLLTTSGQLEILRTATGKKTTGLSISQIKPASLPDMKIQKTPG